MARPVQLDTTAIRAVVPLRGVEAVRRARQLGELIPMVTGTDGAVRLGQAARRDSGRALRLMLRTAERVLLRGDAQAVAQRNAWHAVCADRERAADREAAWSLLGAARPSA